MKMLDPFHSQEKCSHHWSIPKLNNILEVLSIRGKFIFQFDYVYHQLGGIITLHQYVILYQFTYPTKKLTSFWLTPNRTKE